MNKILHEHIFKAFIPRLNQILFMAGLSGRRIVFFGLAAGILLLPAPCRAAVIKLKSGKIISGKIIEKKEDSIIIDMDGISLTYYRDDIDTIDENAAGSGEPQKEQTGNKPADKPQGEIKETLPALSSGAAKDMPGEAPARVDLYLKNGIQFFLEGKSAQAKRQFKKGLNANKNDQNFREFLKILQDLNKGVVKEDYVSSLFRAARYFIDAKYEDVVEELKKTIAINPQYPAAYRTLGFTYFLLRRYADSLPVYEALDRLNPGDLNTLINLAYAYSAVEENDKAIEYYKKIIDLYPAFTESYNNLGTLYIALGKYEDALVYLLKLIEINPDIPQAYNNIGTAYSSLGKYQEATDYYIKAIKINPELVEAHISLAAVYNSLGKTKEARRGFAIAREIFQKRKNPDGVKMIDEILSKIPAN